MFLLFLDTFHIQGDLSFPLFPDTSTELSAAGAMRGVCKCIRTTIPSRPAGQGLVNLKRFITTPSLWCHVPKTGRLTVSIAFSKAEPFVPHSYACTLSKYQYFACQQKSLQRYCASLYQAKFDFIRHILTSIYQNKIQTYLLYQYL